MQEGTFLSDEINNLMLGMKKDSEELQEIYSKNLGVIWTPENQFLGETSLQKRERLEKQLTKTFQVMTAYMQTEIEIIQKIVDARAKREEIIKNSPDLACVLEFMAKSMLREGEQNV